MQLAFSNVDRSSASDERLVDLLSVSQNYVESDDVRALYFANEALILADSLDRAEPQLAALRIIIHALRSTGRARDATPFIRRAVEVARSTDDPEALDDLVDMLGQWAIEVENEPPTQRGTRSRRRAQSTSWLVATITQLERERPRRPLALVPSETPSSIDDWRSNLEIDDSETGLLNARGLNAELLHLDDTGTHFALVQVNLVDSHTPMLEIARRAADMVGDRGIIARNDTMLLTIVLPDFTGIAAMMMAEQFRTAINQTVGTSPVKIGIGVAIKQRDETSRDLLRRVTDRAEEAAYEQGVSVVG